jgi:arylsulfatase A-like enzyme
MKFIWKGEMRMKKNLILISMDETRPDRLGCYRYEKAKTNHINRIAKEGILFEDAFSSSCLTPVAHGSMLCGVHPMKHGVRDPYSYMVAKSLSTILKEQGYRTAGAVGISLIGKNHGFEQGFDYFEEPTRETTVEVWTYEHTFASKREDVLKEKAEDEEKARQIKLEAEEEELMWGGDWVPNIINFIRENKDRNFFVWGHHYKVHQGCEKWYLKNGLIDPRRDDPYMCYYDRKIQLMNDTVFKPIIEILEELGLYEDTYIAALSDHGTNFGEHRVDKIPCLDMVYPQHTTMYDEDLRIAFMMKGPGLPKGKKVKGMVRNIDFVPTILELMDVKVDNDFDGVSLLKDIEKGESKGKVNYAEELYPRRGSGSVQSIRTDKYKYMRNNTKSLEGLYNLENDPGEKANLIMTPTHEEFAMIQQWRKQLDANLKIQKREAKLSDEQKARLESRLKILGYVMDR